MARLMSPISSRKSVPLPASSNLPILRATAPGEGPLLVAEELALQQVLVQRGAVQPDEGPVAVDPRVVDGPRDHLLARPRLAQEQHGHVGVLHLLRRPSRSPSSPRRRWAPGACGCASAAFRGTRMSPAGRPGRSRSFSMMESSSAVIDGLGDVVRRARLHALNGAVDVPVARDDDHGNGRAPPPSAPSGAPGRPPRPGAGRAGARWTSEAASTVRASAAVAASSGVVALEGQELGEPAAQPRLVVNDENVHVHGASPPPSCPCPARWTPESPRPLRLTMA